MILNVKNLSKSYGGVKAVDAINFCVNRGEIVALIGPNGAGKSTCFNLLNGQVKPCSGEISIAGHDYVRPSPRKLFRVGVGRSFQVAEIFPSFSVLENVMMALSIKRSRWLSIWSPFCNQVEQKAMDILQKTGLDLSAETQAGLLAYGDRKRLDLALALANRPELLLMDEPTAGMAASERQQLMQLIKKLSQEDHVAVLFTEHDMDIVFDYADRILVMVRGQLIVSGTPQEVRQHPDVRRYYLG